MESWIMVRNKNFRVYMFGENWDIVEYMGEKILEVEREIEKINMIKDRNKKILVGIKFFEKFEKSIDK